MLFQDAPVEWQLAVEKKCNNNQDAFISKTDYEHRINNQNAKQVCDLFRDLETNFEVKILFILGHANINGPFFDQGPRRDIGPVDKWPI